MTYVNFKLETDADGIALITWDAPGRPHVIDRNVIEELSIYGDVAGVRRTLQTAGELVRRAFCPLKAADRHGRKGGHLLRPVCRSARGSLTPASSTILHRRHPLPMLIFGARTRVLRGVTPIALPCSPRVRSRPFPSEPLHGSRPSRHDADRNARGTRRVV